MPFTFNGIGTTLYGAREFRPDGSYITTEWFVFAYIPILPLNSLRILETGNDKNYVFYQSSGYAILERTKPNVRQVLSIFGWSAIVVFAFFIFGIFQVWWSVIPMVLALGAPWYLRRRAIKIMVKRYQLSATASD